jgi:GT2 family glycosyltransferase
MDQGISQKKIGNLKVSVVIPTYNRPHDLSACFDSLLTQTILPLEVAVVDNGTEMASKALVDEREKEFADRGIALRYVRNDRNSLTAARNVGSRLSSGDIVLFLDDDVILDRDYIQEIIRVYEMNPNALGVQGYMAHEEGRGMRDFFHRLFFWYHLERDRCRVLPSVSATYPLSLGKVIECQWLSGANQSYRRGILEEFQYDERLLKYAEGEDLEFSYRVFKKYPGSLFITPFARLIHNTSMQGRALGRELVYMREVYGLYLFFKLFDPGLKSKLIYLWSRIGRLVLTLARAGLKRPPGISAELRYLLGAYYLCLRHLREVKGGDLEFFNRTLV